MKKFFALLLCIVMMLSVVACGNTTNNGDDQSTDNKTNEETPAVEAEYKLGMGVSVSMDSSKKDNAQVDATVATVVLDKDGKIVMCRIDVAQNKMAVANGAVEAEKKFETKMELGDRYGMAGKVDNNDDGVMLEWDVQVKELEKFVVGKTVAEIEALTTQEAKGHNISTDEALLKAGCTMDIVEFKNAIVKACKDEQGMAFKTAAEFTLGVAAKTNVDASTVAATADAEGKVAMYTDFGAAVVVEGKIVAALNDAIQPTIAIKADGEIGDKTFKATKRELKEEYNMAKFGANLDNNGDGKVLEYYVQSEAFSKHVVGMTAADVTAMTTAAATQGSVGYMISTDADLLAAGCTIQIANLQAVVAQAATNVR